MSKIWLMNDLTFLKLSESVTEDELTKGGITIKLKNSIENDEVIVIEQPSFPTLSITNYIR